MTPATQATHAPGAASTRRFDVCNGDADGLCAVVQWRLHAPAPSTLVTGLKRDIALLDRVPAAAGDEVLVCDVSMRRNRRALLRLLELGARVRYFDHHAADGAPQHPLLETHVELDSDVCTSLLVDRHLGGRWRAWALVGAYGDNLAHVADGLAASMALSAEDRDRLRMLGEAINYNAYGEQESDVHIAPAALYRTLIRYPDPLQLLAHETIARELDAARHADLEQAKALAPHWSDARTSVHLLPDAPWSRRAIGCLANELALGDPGRAHAVLKAGPAGDYTVSVRAPLHASGGANALCRSFGGGGRAVAAGIDGLPASELERFIAALAAQHWSEEP